MTSTSSHEYMKLTEMFDFHLVFSFTWLSTGPAPAVHLHQVNSDPHNKSGRKQIFTHVLFWWSSGNSFKICTEFGWKSDTWERKSVKQSPSYHKRLHDEKQRWLKMLLWGLFPLSHSIETAPHVKWIRMREREDDRTHLQCETRRESVFVLSEADLRSVLQLRPTAAAVI